MRARGKAKLKLIKRIRDAAEHDWRAARWLLERMFPAEFGTTEPRKPEPNEKGSSGPAITFVLQHDGKQREVGFDHIQKLYRYRSKDGS
jgi:hypothetical protein